VLFACSTCSMCQTNCPRRRKDRGQCSRHEGRAL
jgi:hypothetical protein